MDGDAIPARGERPLVRWRVALLAGLAGALLLGALARDVIGHPPTYDELLHVLAARGLEASGQPTIADGRYDRALAYTHATALAIRLAGDELLGARLLAWLGAALLVALVTAWTARRAGLLAGVVAGGMLAVHPWTLDLAVFARFYTWHALAVAVLFCAAWAAVEAATARTRLLAVAIAIAALGPALVLQITTVIAVTAIALGLAAGLAIEHRDRVATLLRRHALPLAIGVVVLAAVALAALHALDLLAPFRETPLWSAGDAGRVTYYTTELMRATPLLWPVLPAAAVAALLWRPRLALPLAVAALVAFAVHSLAAAKATRYAYYALPWLCMLLGIGAASAFERLRSTRVRVAAVALAGCALLLSQEGWRTLRILAGADGASRVLAYGDESDWSSALPAMRAALVAGDAIVASNSMKALWYLGRYDYELNASVVRETDTGREFGRDPRAGRPVVSTPESLGAVLRERDRVLVVVETEKLARPTGVPGETVALLVGACAPLALPRESGLTAWSCPATAEPPPPPASAG